MGRNSNLEGEYEEVGEPADVDTVDDGPAEEDEADANRPVIDLTESPPSPRRFYANLADL
jgi:hypothetical protein